LYECQGLLKADTPLPESTSKEVYLRGVDAAKALFAKGDLQKAVLSRCTRVPLDQGRMAELFMGACAERPHAFVALINTPEHGTWLGASPERLIWAEEDHVRVDALAGTMASDSAPHDAAAWGQKERNEQQLVVQSVLDTFERTRLGNIVVHPPETVDAGEVVHLRTRLEADLGESTLGDVVLALHPTPAVCGTPPAGALAFIERHEGHDRGLYTGFWGPWNPDGCTELYVNIRCLRQAGNEAVLYMGAGITAGSEPQREWDETEQKARTWLRPIQALK
jgi:isochorismate synthase